MKSAIATRRDRFISPQFTWLQACLDQALRPNDRQVFKVLVNAANRITDLENDPALLAAEAEAEGRSFLEQWAIATQTHSQPIAARLAEFALRLVQSRGTWRAVMNEALAYLPTTVSATASEGIVTDAADDKAAWETAIRAMRSEKADELELAELLQGLALRPKEPPADPEAVALLTVHAAKGLEFDHVYIVGLAETVLPSWQSLQPKARPEELEEERRNCFVAITRTRRTLILSRAQSYRGWPKTPSRFLKEMQLLEDPDDSKTPSSRAHLLQFGR